MRVSRETKKLALGTLLTVSGTDTAGKFHSHSNEELFSAQHFVLKWLTS